MLSRMYLSLLLFISLPVWSQSSSSVNISESLTGESGMQTPPPVSSENYPTEVGAEMRSNYINTGIVFLSSYNNDVTQDSSGRPISDASYSIRPSIAFDKVTSRLHGVFSYSPGFTFYNRTSQLNEADQSLAGNVQYRLSPHVTGSVYEEFWKSSNAFSQADGLSNDAVSGSVQKPITAIVAPLANQTNNSSSAQLTYQYSRNDMIGGSGNFASLHYGDSNQVPGLSNSDSKSGMIFYSRRLSAGKYLGATYQYSSITASSPTAESSVQSATESQTQIQSLMLFFTMYFRQNFSFSLSGGPQKYESEQPSEPQDGSWAPALVASLGWQGQHTNFSVSYAHLTFAGGGLVGAYHGNSVAAAARWQASRTWTLGAGLNYLNSNNVSRILEFSTPNGNSTLGSVTVQHPLSERIEMEFGYSHLLQNYKNVEYVVNAPNMSRAYISISYKFSRMIGR